MPKAAVRDEVLEAQIISAVEKTDEFSDLELAICVLPTKEWSPLSNPRQFDEAMIARTRWAFVGGHDNEGQMTFQQVRVQQHVIASKTAHDHSEDQAFVDSVIELAEVHSVRYIVSDDGVEAGIQLRRRRVLSRVTIHNRMLRRVKVQSIDSNNDDFEELTIAPRTRKVFNYLADADVFNIRDAETSKLIQSLDPQKPGFGMAIIEV